MSVEADLSVGSGATKRCIVPRLKVDAPALWLAVFTRFDI